METDRFRPFMRIIALTGIANIVDQISIDRLWSWRFPVQINAEFSEEFPFSSFSKREISRDTKIEMEICERTRIAFCGISCRWNEPWVCDDDQQITRVINVPIYYGVYIGREKKTGWPKIDLIVTWVRDTSSVQPDDAEEHVAHGARSKVRK